MDPKYLQELFEFNRWANKEMLEAASKLSLEELSRDLHSSFPSVRDTLVHIMWAEWIWLRRWKGESPQLRFQAEDFPEVAVIKTRWLEVQAEQMPFVKSVTESNLQRSLSYVNLRGETWTYALWRMMVHLVNHSSYHRGQIVTMFRQLGQVPPATDFLVFCDLHK